MGDHHYSTYLRAIKVLTALQYSTFVLQAVTTHSTVRLYCTFYFFDCFTPSSRFTLTTVPLRLEPLDPSSHHDNILLPSTYCPPERALKSVSTASVQQERLHYSRRRFRPRSD